MGRGLAAVVAVALSVVPARADSALELRNGGFKIRVDQGGQANLIYQLDCLSHTVSCTSEVFEQLWQGRLGLDADDRKALADWAAVRGAVQNESYAGENTLPVKSVVPIVNFGTETKWDALRIGEFGAATLDDVKRRWSALLPEESVQKLAAVVARFRPRFDTWWAESERYAAEMMPNIETAMVKARAGELLDAAARLYRADLGDKRLSLHLVVQPKSRPGRSRAGLVGAHLVVEIYPGEKAEERVSVIVHELAHHVFARMPGERMAALAEALIATGPSGTPAWNLFNEVQATVIGNMLAERNVSAPEAFQKMLDRPQSFYADEAIDRGARATEQVFVQAFKAGGDMKPSFAKDFVAAMRASMGPMLETPALQLRAMVLNTAEDDTPWRGKLREVIRPWSTWGISPLGSPSMVTRLEQYPGLSALIIAAPDQVGQLAPAAGVLGATPEVITQALGSSRGIVFVTQRTPLAYAFIVIGRDAPTTGGLIAALASCSLKPGVCVRFE